MEEKKNLLGVRKKSIKRHKKKLLSKVIDYLKSDDYMFAPILFAPPPTSGKLLPKQQAFPRAVAIEEPGKEDEGKKKRMIDEVWSYLLSDSYMYAPCTDDGDSDGRRDAKRADSRRGGGGEKLLRSDDRRSGLTESAAGGMGKRASEEGRLKGTAVKRARVVEQHHQIQAVKKYMVYQSCHS